MCRRLVGPILLSSVLLSAGCASDRRSDTLNSTLIAYANAVRWEGFEGAQMFVDPKLRADHPITELDRERFKQLQVNDYDDDVPVPAGKYEVRQTVRIGLTNVHTQAVRTIVDHQVWRYDPDQHKWWLETGIPNLNQ